MTPKPTLSPQKKKLRISQSSPTVATAYPTQSLNLLMCPPVSECCSTKLGHLHCKFTFKGRCVILWPFLTYIHIHVILLKDTFWVGTKLSKWLKFHKTNPNFPALLPFQPRMMSVFAHFSNDLFNGSWMTVLRSQESELAGSIQKEMA